MVKKSVDDGFDIVIGNPPYVRHEKIKNLKPDLQKQKYEVFTSTADLYVYFYEKGYKLLKDKGILSFITSNKWMRAKYGKALREFLKNNTTILEIIDFGGYPVFEQTVDTSIVLFRKERPTADHCLRYAIVPSDLENHSQAIEYIKSQLKTNRLLQSKLSESAYTLADDRVLKLKEKIERIGKALKEWDVKIYRGIITGFNDAFIITTEKRNEILANCKDEEERKRTEEIIKPILRGRDIGRYYYKWAGLWLIATFPALRLDIENYPALKKYFLDNFDIRQLEQSGKKYPELGFNARKKTNNKWFETQDNIAYYPEFEKEKIVFNQITQDYSFAFDNNKIYVNQSSYIMTGQNLKLILAILNSSFVKFVYKNFYSGGGIEGEITIFTLEQLPIPPITPQNQHIASKIEEKVNQILSITQSEDYPENPQKQEEVKKLEKEIDQLVYELYELTEEEIRIVEGEG